MSTLAEGLQEQLLQLTDLYQSTVGDPEQPRVCARCYLAERDCLCGSESAPWPIATVIVQVRAKLDRELDESTRLL